MVFLTLMAGAVKFGIERNEMKKEDKVIERENDREVTHVSLIAISSKVIRKSLPNGEVTYQSIDSDAWPSEVKHFTHHHVLTQVFSQERFQCDGCREIGQGDRYCCVDTACKTENFQLHMFCALPPTMLSSAPPSSFLSTIQFLPNQIQSPVHKDHRLKEVYKNSKFNCNRCKTNGYGIRFHCDYCNIDFHQICAEHPYKVLSFMHPQHELVLKTKHMFDACDLCRKIGYSNTRMYGCEDCDFWVHPTCIQWPQYLIHSLHPLHPLKLKCMPSSVTCDSQCGKKCKKWRYTCEFCHVHLHLNCLLTKSMKDDDGSKSVNLQSLEQAVEVLHSIKNILELTLQ